MVRKFGVIAASAVLVLTAACGSGGGRPSADDISKSLLSGAPSAALGSLGANLSKKAADCIGKAFVDSDLSDAALQAIVKKDKNFSPSSTDTKALSSIIAAVEKCVTG